jgi:hypothetical protein
MGIECVQGLHLKNKVYIFDEDRSLHDTIKNDVDPQHLYINFSNESCPYAKEVTNDGNYHYDMTISVSHFDMISVHESFSSHTTQCNF